ncbi:MAG: hypothetical protein R2862_11150 [Thermoanaerobaculia bacterium]
MAGRSAAAVDGEGFGREVAASGAGPALEELTQPAVELVEIELRRGDEERFVEAVRAITLAGLPALIDLELELVAVACTWPRNLT